MSSLPHRIERTKNKHSRAVVRDDTIVIRLAKRLSKAQEQEHIDFLLQKMTSKLAEDAKNTLLIHPFKDLLAGHDSTDVYLDNGQCYRFELTTGERLSKKRTKTGWQIRVSPGTDRKKLHRYLWKVLIEEHQGWLTARTAELNAANMNLKYSKVRCSFAGSQWGSCSPSGVIMLNAALLFVPGDVLDYVILHELAHLKHADHSARYWNFVETYCPRYRELRKELHGFRLPRI